MLDHNTITIGKLGEELASRFLAMKGYDVFERNYREKWGEIDLIARKSGRIHFVEVKTKSRVSGETGQNGYRADLIPRQTRYGQEEYRAEENVHPQKLLRLGRAIETFRVKRKLEDEDFQLDVVIVNLNLKDKTAKIHTLDNVL